jgi:hypothetical protein
VINIEKEPCNGVHGWLYLDDNGNICDPQTLDIIPRQNYLSRNSPVIGLKYTC